MNVCPIKDHCGGCAYMGMDYRQQLLIKQKEIQVLFPREKINPVYGMENPYHYRHKIYCTFYKDARGHVSAGMYEEDSHRLIRSRDCLIQCGQANKIITSICHIATGMKIEPYDEDSGKGVLRHAYIRVSHKTGKALATIVIGSREIPGGKKFFDLLRNQNPEIETVLLNWNGKHTSMILGERERIIYGKGYLMDELCGLKFRISSRSFYQINPVQTEKLYQKAIELADIHSHDIVLDACCGIGTISLAMAEKGADVIGVEINPDSIKDAQYNARMNHISNAQFFCMDASDFMDQIESGIHTVMMDPPRSGMGEKFMKSLLRLKPERIVYISCNPETQAEDLKMLKRIYQMDAIVPFDQFPFTKHTENICSLSIKK